MNDRPKQSHGYLHKSYLYGSCLCSPGINQVFRNITDLKVALASHFLMLLVFNELAVEKSVSIGVR